MSFDKLQELRIRLELMKQNLSIIALLEIKPKTFKHEKSLAEYNLEVYDILPLNICKNDCGRGMNTYIKSDVRYSPVNIASDFREFISAETAINNIDILLFTSVNRSPSLTAEESERLNVLFRVINQKNYSHVLILGDFNYPCIDWMNCATNRRPGDNQYEFIETARDCFLYQHILEPTGGRGTNEPSCLDVNFHQRGGYG